jgi:hypothetical protein
VTTYTVGFTPSGYALVRWVAGVPTTLGTYPTEAAALAALLVVAVTTVAAGD